MTTSPHDCGALPSMIDAAYIYWNADPDLLQLGSFRVRWYGLCFAAAFVAGFYLMRWIYRREGKPLADLEPLALYMFSGTLVGARLGHVLFYQPGYYLPRPLEIIKIWEGGLASHGGVVGILIALYVYTRRRPGQRREGAEGHASGARTPGVPYGWLLDRMAVPAALGGCFIRLGNFFNSEILGVPAEVPWAVIFTRVDAVPRHPAQLYESLSYLVIFFVLLRVYRRWGRHVPRGLLLGLLLVLVFGARFLIEFVKVRQAAFGQALPLGVGQLLSIPAVGAGAALLSRAHKARRGEAV